MLSILVAFIFILAEGAKPNNGQRQQPKTQGGESASNAKSETKVYAYDRYDNRKVEVKAPAKPEKTTQVVAVDRFRGRTTVVTVPAKSNPASTSQAQDKEPKPVPGSNPPAVKPATQPVNPPAVKAATQPTNMVKKSKSTEPNPIKIASNIMQGDTTAELVVNSLVAGTAAGGAAATAVEVYYSTRGASTIAGGSLRASSFASQQSLGSANPAGRAWVRSVQGANGFDRSFTSQQSMIGVRGTSLTPEGSIRSLPSSDFGGSSQLSRSSSFSAGTPTSSSGTSSLARSSFGSSTSSQSAAGAGVIGFVGTKPAGASVKGAPAKPSDLSQAQATYARTAISRSGLAASQPTNAQIQAAAKQGYQYVGNGMFAKFNGKSNEGMTLVKSTAFKVAGTPTAVQRGLAPKSGPSAPNAEAFAQAVAQLTSAKTPAEIAAATSRLVALRRGGNPTFPRAS